MADPLSATAVGVGLLGYNRQNWMWDKTVRQKREYQGQAMNIKRFELYREDIDNLAELTISKMDNYLIINILLMGFCVKLFTEGRPQPGDSPPWLHWLYAATNSGALMYFILSVWLAMHASIAAHSFQVRLLTQFVRLPIPSKEQIDAARFYAQDFETKKAKDLFRVPVLSEMFRNLSNTMNNQTASTPDAMLQGADRLTTSNSATVMTSNVGMSALSMSMGPDAVGAEVAGPAEALSVNPVLEGEAAKLQHVKLYRHVQSNWQAYDAYARVSMAIGVNQLMSALSYFCLIMFVGENHVTWPALMCTLAFAGCGYLLARLDLFVPRSVIRRTGIMMTVCPLLSFITIIADKAAAPPQMKRITDALVPVCFAIHMYWIWFIISMARAEVNDGMALPLKFRSVLFLDVYGWIRSGSSKRRADASGVGRPVCAAVEASLAKWCCEKLVKLDRELCLWETPDVQGNLIQQQAMVYVQCRSQFNQIQGELREQLLNSEHCDVFNREMPEDGGGVNDVWLKLLYEQPAARAGGAPVVKIFYRRPDRDESVARLPDGTMVSDLEALQVDVVDFERKVQKLVRMIVRHRAPPPPTDRTCERPAPAAGQLPGSDSHSQSASFPLRAESHTSRSSRGLPASQMSATDLHAIFAPATHEEAGNAAQETRFGGREAVELSAAPWLLGTGAEAAATFTPELRETAPRVQVRPPGHFPWLLFYQGSLCLMAVWGIGFCWCVVQYSFFVPMQLKPKKVGLWDLEVNSAVGPQRIFDGGLQHALFSPQGLLCNDALGSTMFVYERHAVRAIHFDGLGDGARRGGAWSDASLHGCMRNIPSFQDEGVAAVALRCKAAGSCEALLLAADGKSLAECPVTGSEAVALNASSAFGGPWRALALASDGAAWALRDDDSGALVELRPRLPGSEGSGLLPRLQVADNAAGLRSLASVGGGRAILGLEADGHLHAWLLQRGRHVAWQLPRYARWTGVCETSGQLFFGGVEQTSRGLRFGIWRAGLPPELQFPTLLVESPATAAVGERPADGVAVSV